MKDSCNLKLFIGKPVDVPGNYKETHIATFSRFVLPFAYKLENISNNTPPFLHYVLNPTNDLSFIKRRKYYTRETAYILYDKTLWMDMCPAWESTPWGKEEVQVTLRNRKFLLGMLPPRIVLFEAGGKNRPHPLSQLAQTEEPDILHTGFLHLDVFFSENQDHAPELDDLLVLNEFFRYYNIPYDEHAKIFKQSFGNIPADYSDSPSPIKNLGPLECYFERWANLLEIPILDNGRKFRFFPTKWGQAARDWSYNNPIGSDHWHVYADNRAYIWTVAFLDRGGKALKTCFCKEAKQLRAHEYGHWIKLMNSDPPDFDIRKLRYHPVPMTHASTTEFEKQWAYDRTYRRWEERGTWYGFCYHSSAALAPPEYRIFSPWKTYYFDTTLLLFFIRMSLFRFSKALSEIVDDKIIINEIWRNKLTELRRKFSRFTILYRYPFVSNQQQMIEMYELERKSFDVESLFQEVQQEIDNTHEFLEAIEATRLSKIANRLAAWGIPLAVGGLATALFSMSDNSLWDCWFGDEKCAPDADRLLQAGIILLVIAIAAVGLKLWDLREQKGDKP